MTIHDYLRSKRAVQDLQAIYKRHQKAIQRPGYDASNAFEFGSAGVGGKWGTWSLQPRGAWLEIELRFDDEDKCDIQQDRARCYCTPIGETLVITDCGETSTAMLLRQGWPINHEMSMLAMSYGLSLKGDVLVNNATSGSRLMSAILTVLSAVADVRRGLGVV